LSSGRPAISDAKIKGGIPLKFTFAHNNFNVLDLARSLDFYRDALDLTEVRRIVPEDGSFILVFLGDSLTPHRLELTWLKDRKDKYDLGENEIHLAFTVDDYAAAYARHKAMGIICYENTKMGIYFIEDPDGYWVEIVPVRK
jgi:lactoylglutathione lyase